MPLTLQGAHEAGAEEKLTNGLVEGLGRGGVKVLTPEEIGANAPVGGCADSACIEQVAGAASLTYVVQATIAIEERDYTIDLALSNADGKSVATLTEHCDICGIDEVVSLLADLAGGMQSKLDTLARSAPTINVTAEPAGAKVFVDDQLVGTTPFKGEVAEGRHEIRVEAEGYLPRKKRINGVEGTREDLNFVLEAVPTDTAGAKKRRKALVGSGATALGLGVAMIGGGLPLVLIHDTQNKNRCSGNDKDINGTCRYSYDTLAGGLGLTVGGAVVAAVGVGLLARARIERKKLEAQAFIGPRGIAIVGRF